MTVKNAELLVVAQKLRNEGKSYSEIANQTKIPKSTLSHWLSQDKKSQSVRFELTQKNKERNKDFSIRMGKIKGLQKLKRREKYRREAKTEYKRIKDNSLFIAGISIYWGEGEKAENGRVSISNTDAEMLQVVLKFYKQILHISDDQLRGAIFTYKDLNKTKVLEFWSKKTGIPKNQFIKTQVLPSRSTLAKRKVLNGICTVYFSSTQTHIKIIEWIKLFASDMRA